MTSRILGAFVIAALMLPSVARAQSSPTDQAAAQELFDAAKKLVQANKYADACPKFEESQRLDPAPGTHFNLADCWEHVGRTASAWAAYIVVADALKAAGQKDREKVARDRANALQAKLVRLNVTLAADARVAGLEVKRDGVVLREAQWGIAVPVDPGPHVVAATAPNVAPWQQSVDVAGEGKTITVEVPKLGAQSPENPPQPTPPLATPKTAEAPQQTPASQPVVISDERPSDGSGQRMLGLVVAGVGVVGLGVGGVFGIQSFSKHSDYTKHCNANNECDAEGVKLHDEAVSAGTLSTILMGVGVVALGAGAVLFFTAPKKATTGITVSPTLGGLTMRGMW